ncbi:MAG TPA: hypothetical protein VGK26_00295 [Thermoanaerobaculia bacterium]
MDASRRSFLPLGFFTLVALLVGFLLARLIPTKGGPAPNNQFIKVGPRADQISGDVEPAISRYAGHEATWKSTSGKPLRIFFKKSELPSDLKGNKLPPFESMDDAGDRWEVKILAADPAWRFSGPINPKLELSQDPKVGLEFKYWQYLQDANPPEADGKIIIKW